MSVPRTSTGSARAPARVDETTAAAPSADLTSSFFDDGDVNAVQIVQSTQVSVAVEDEQMQGESDEEEPVILLPRRKTKRKKDHRRIVVNNSACKYPIVVESLKRMGWRQARLMRNSEELEEANLVWNDSYIHSDVLSTLNKYQKANHFPGMSEIAKKNLLAKNLNRMMKLLPADFDFFPPSFSLPADLELLRQFLLNNSTSHKRRPTIIVKPDAGCQGKGIFLTRSIDDCAEVEGMVAQQYLTSPLLVEGYKFDLRIYVLVVSTSPLHALIFKEGLARFCTERYKPPTDGNLHETFMHLTNFAINKHHEDFTIEEEGEGGHKRSLSSLMGWLSKNGYPAETVWSQIKAVIVKTLLTVQPQLSHVYHSIFGEENPGFSCFEILGFDILLDNRARPWLLEVNHAPSLSCGSPLDEQIKAELVHDTMNLIQLVPYHKRRFRQEQAAARQKRMQSRQKGTSTAEQRESARREARSKARSGFEEHEAKCLQHSNFERLYPDPARAEEYRRVLALAQETYEGFTTFRSRCRAKLAPGVTPAPAPAAAPKPPNKKPKAPKPSALAPIASHFSGLQQLNPMPAPARARMIAGQGMAEASSQDAISNAISKSIEEEDGMESAYAAAEAINSSRVCTAMSHAAARAARASHAPAAAAPSFGASSAGSADSGLFGGAMQQMAADMGGLTFGHTILGMGSSSAECDGSEGLTSPGYPAEGIRRGVHDPMLGALRPHRSTQSVTRRPALDSSSSSRPALDSSRSSRFAGPPEASPFAANGDATHFWPRCADSSPPPFQSSFAARHSKLPVAEGGRVSAGASSEAFDGRHEYARGSSAQDAWHSQRALQAAKGEQPRAQLEPAALMPGLSCEGEGCSAGAAHGALLAERALEWLAAERAIASGSRVRPESGSDSHQVSYTKLLGGHVGGSHVGSSQSQPPPTPLQASAAQEKKAAFRGALRLQGGFSSGELHPKATSAAMPTAMTFRGPAPTSGAPGAGGKLAGGTLSSNCSSSAVAATQNGRVVRSAGTVAYRVSAPDPPTLQPRTMRASEVFSHAGEQGGASRSASGKAHVAIELLGPRSSSTALAAWAGAGKLPNGRRMPLNPGITQIELGKAKTARGEARGGGEVPGARRGRTVANTVIRFLPPTKVQGPYR